MEHQTPENSAVSAPSIADSPWFWMLIFSCMGLAVLATAWPKYVRRQARIELQYHASQEITRRRVQGEAAARVPGDEGEAVPPAAGELIISLWPIALVLLLAASASAVMLRRSRRALTQPRSPPNGAAS